MIPKVCTHDWRTAGSPPLTSCQHCGRIWKAPAGASTKPSGNGKQGQAPCGHPGTAVVGNFYTCNLGCDSVPEYVEAETTDKHGVDGFDLDGWFDPCPPHDLVVYSFGVSKCLKCGMKAPV